MIPRLLTGFICTGRVQTTYSIDYVARDLLLGVGNKDGRRSNSLSVRDRSTATTSFASYPVMAESVLQRHGERAERSLSRVAAECLIVPLVVLIWVSGYRILQLMK